MNMTGMEQESHKNIGQLANTDIDAYTVVYIISAIRFSIPVKKESLFMFTLFSLQDYSSFMLKTCLALAFR